MLGFLGCERCLFQKLYVKRFVDSFATIVFHAIGLELIIVVVFLHHLIRITTQLLVHTLHFCLLLCLLWRRISFPTLVWSCTKYLWAPTQNSCLVPALKHWWMSFSSSFWRNKGFWSSPVRLMWWRTFFLLVRRLNRLQLFLKIMKRHIKKLMR